MKKKHCNQTSSNVAVLNNTIESNYYCFIQKIIESGFILPYSCGTDPDPDSQHCLKKVKVGKVPGRRDEGREWRGRRLERPPVAWPPCGGRGGRWGGGPTGRPARGRAPRPPPPAAEPPRQSGPPHTTAFTQYGKQYKKCCGSGMFIPDPGSEFFTSRIQGPGSKRFRIRDLYQRILVGISNP